jgi:hypothetical protein
MERRLFLVGLPLLAAACVRDNTIVTKNPDDGGTGPTPVEVVHEFEFRVNGVITGQVDITMSNTQEGTTLLRSDVPWFVTVKSVRKLMFVSLTASSFNFGKLTVQIFVDGQLFREASADGFSPSCSVSGQWSA